MSKKGHGPWDHVERDLTGGFFGRLFGIGGHSSHQPDQDLMKGVAYDAEGGDPFARKRVARQQGQLAKKQGSDPFSRRRARNNPRSQEGPKDPWYKPFRNGGDPPKGGDPFKGKDPWK